ncbi:SDR family oxidoreductase [Paenibacillus sp. RC67]|uniref:SDR family oxidoreductase n=1 Tax=Paenibacillus sp. RC67 TaxID=3039392 RepID=UPI0024ADE8A4|nr:SDR family oxidoreductase [Paenibacillus sp. RC67]
MKYTGKVVLVTGASRGIGRKIAEQFGLQGAKVVVNYSSNSHQAEEVVSAIKKKGGEASAVQADISRVSEINKLFKSVLDIYGQLDILVNNAGVMVTKPIEQMTEEDFDRMFDINVKGTYFACQQAVQHMKANGRIINFSTSVVGAMFPQYSAYAGTKGAVEQFTRQLAKEFGPRQININAVAPGPVGTELFMQGKSEDQIRQMSSLNAFGRLGETGDISDVVLFLASEEARWITGQTLRINGGFV